MLEIVFMIATLVIGWLVWSLVVWGRGQTPAKQVLRMRTVSLEAGRSASWGRMFLREIIAKPIVGVLAWLTLGIANFWLVWDKQNQELWDKVVGTVVVTDRERALLEKKTYAIGSERSGQLPRARGDALPYPARSSQADRLESPPNETVAQLRPADTDREGT